ncbi:tyrosine-protein kinase receptor torso-like isoform X2 [Sipha flava]|uniref:receptor protein-tyrosine kinase n=1 Tax=Sipha flava TaxID=143950 RepID=A0A8B8FV46_9HEMI|nr:tyrosine-protein kinase receptor torso-like isoform X2 [Sipha flava]
MLKRDEKIDQSKNFTCVKDWRSYRSDMSVIDNARLLCREFDSLTFVWDDKRNATTYNDPVLIFVEFLSYNTSRVDMRIIKKVNSLSYIRFDDLMPNTEHAARFWTVTDGIVYRVMDTPVHKTLDKARVPDPVRAIQISGFNNSLNTKNNNSRSIETSLTWERSIDNNCNYKIIYYPKKMEIPKWFYLDVAKSYPVTLTSLTIDNVYTVSIRAYYRKTSPPITSKNIIFVFSTPSCLERFDPISCPPGTPYNLSVDETLDRGEGRYNVKMSWKSRNTGGVGVDYFTVKLDGAKQQVPGTVNNAYFKDVPLSEHYFASVQAFSRTDHSDETVVREPRRIKYIQGSVDHGSFYLWTAAAFAFCCMALTLGQYAYGRWAADDDRKASAVVAAGVGYDMAALQGLDDVDVVLRREDVIVSDVVLGHGNFGEVRKAVLKTDGGELPVAVKWLRDHPTGRESERFIHEILLMQTVGKHVNIVSMIGCCLDVNKRCMLVVEYCPLGDLQTYLRKINIKSWYVNDFNVDRVGLPITVNDKENTMLDTGNTSLATNGGSPPMVFNNCYLYHDEENVFLTIEDLIRFASQVANGMVFLEQNHIVHRDLAARNILLSDYHTIKICDFGLSRDIYEQNHYKKSNCGDPLPIKWMALESLKYRVYTTQSDVWSFGVLLWEIMMLGSIPYPTICLSKIYEVLRRGYRLPRPNLCCYRLYEIMLGCWQSNPANRPKFASIKDAIDGIMENQYS